MVLQASQLVKERGLKMEEKNQLIVNEVNAKLAIYLGFVFSATLLAIGNNYNFDRSNVVLQVIYWVNVIGFFGLLYYLYGRTQALIYALRKNVSIEEAEDIVMDNRVAKVDEFSNKQDELRAKTEEKRARSDKIGEFVSSEKSDYHLFGHVLWFLIKMVPLAFFFAYMMIVTIIDYIKGNSKPSEFIQNFKNSLRKQAVTATN